VYDNKSGVSVDVIPNLFRDLDSAFEVQPAGDALLLDPREPDPGELLSLDPDENEILLDQTIVVAGTVVINAVASCIALCLFEAISKAGSINRTSASLQAALKKPHGVMGKAGDLIYPRAVAGLQLLIEIDDDRPDRIFLVELSRRNNRFGSRKFNPFRRLSSQMDKKAKAKGVGAEDGYLDPEGADVLA
jgi:hypothetical protein